MMKNMIAGGMIACGMGLYVLGLSWLISQSPWFFFILIFMVGSLFAWILKGENG